MPIHPVPFITLRVDPKHSNGTSESHEDGTEEEEHYHFEINPEAAKMLQNIEEPVSVCAYIILRFTSKYIITFLFSSSSLVYIDFIRYIMFNNMKRVE